MKTKNHIKSPFEVTEIWPMDVDQLMKLEVFREEPVFMSSVRPFDSARPLPQLKLEDSWSAANLPQRVNIEHHYEKPDMGFLQTSFQKLSYTIEVLFVDRNIQSIRSKEFEDHRETITTTRKLTDQRSLKINVVLDEHTNVKVNEIRNTRDLLRQPYIKCWPSEDGILDILYMLPKELERR